MSEENQTEEQERTYTKDDVERTKSNFITQISELKKQLNNFEAEKAERAEAETVAEKERLSKNEEYKTLVEKLNAELKEKENERNTLESNLTNKLNSMQQENIIVQNGITDDITILGLKAKYNGLEEKPDFKEWFDSQNLTKGKSSGTAGSVSQNNSGSLEQRLNSDDPKVKILALKEQLKNDLIGS